MPSQLQISDLPSKASLLSTDKFGVDDASRITWKVTSNDIFNFITSNLTITNFNQIAPTTTKGDLIVNNGGGNVRQAVGTNAFVLTADSTQPTGIKWAPVPSSGDNVIVVGTTTTLTAAQLGSIIWCQNSGNITINLPPSASATAVDQGFEFVFDCNPGTFVTISPHVGDTIYGVASSSYIFAIGEGVTLVTDTIGTWIPSSISLQPVNIKLALALSAIYSGTPILWDTTVSKTNMTYNAGTGVITPLFPGRYAINATVQGGSTVAVYTMNLSVVTTTDTPSSSVFLDSNANFTSNKSISIAANHAFQGISASSFTVNYNSTIAITSGTQNNYMSATRINNYG